MAKANVWYLVAEKTPGELRNYRVGRIKQAALTNEHFIRQPEFDLATYWEESIRNYERNALEHSPRYATILAVHPKAFWYFPAYMEGHYEQTGEPDARGWVKLRVSFEALGDARMNSWPRHGR